MAKISGLITQFGNAPPHAIQSAPDAELLRQFITTRDELAFAELVRRHGPLVWGVCRRVTGNHHLAEDAFQAVFVVLATKAAVIRPPSAVAGWLYGVAFRTALRARTMADRRRRRESTVQELPDSPSPEPPASPDAVALLDEEIAKLPDHYRLPVVLCELGGLTRKDAASQLGIAEGTLSSRLAAARKALADRLRLRGVALSAAGLSTVLAQAAGAVPPRVLAVKAAACATPAPLPASVVDLSQGVLRIMFLQKLKIAGPLAILVVGLLVAGGLAAANRLADPPPTKSAPLVLVPGNAEPARNLAPAQSKVLVWRRGELVMIGPDGTNEKVVLTRGGGISAASFALSPDGTRVAVIQPTNLEEPGEAPREVIMHLFVYELGRGGAGTDLGPAGRACWSPDGKQLAVNQLKEAEKLEDFRATHELVTVATRERSPLKLPADHFVVDWSRDGRFFLTAKPGGDFQKPSMELFLMNRDGTQHKQLISARTFLSSARLSADSQRVLWMTMKPKEEFAAEKRAREEAGGFPPRPTFELTVLDIATQKSTTVASVPENAEIRECCWSPDGKRIAYTWREALPTDPKEAIGKEKICHLTTCDPDGQNPKTILTARSDGTFSHPLDGLDWQFVAAEDKKTDAEKLAGTWKLVSVTDGGKKKTPDDGIFVIAKDTITFQRPGQPRTLSYKLDPTKKPRWITLEGNNVTTLGIYELDGDNLKLCFNDDPKGERPGKFASEPNSPNDLLMVLKREK